MKVPLMRGIGSINSINSDIKCARKWNEPFAEKRERTMLKQTREKVEKPIKIE